MIAVPGRRSQRQQQWSAKPPIEPAADAWRPRQQVSNGEAHLPSRRTPVLCNESKGLPTVARRTGDVRHPVVATQLAHRASDCRSASPTSSSLFDAGSSEYQVAQSHGPSATSRYSSRSLPGPAGRYGSTSAPLAGTLGAVPGGGLLNVSGGLDGEPEVESYYPRGRSLDMVPEQVGSGGWRHRCWAAEGPGHDAGHTVQSLQEASTCPS